MVWTSLAVIKVPFWRSRCRTLKAVQLRSQLAFESVRVPSSVEAVAVPKVKRYGGCPSTKCPFPSVSLRSQGLVPSAAPHVPPFGPPAPISRYNVSSLASPEGGRTPVNRISYHI